MAKKSPSRFRCRTVILENGAQVAVDSYKKSLNRFADSFDALEWLLARSPKNGEVLGGGYYLYVQGADEIAETSEIWVLYKFNIDEVTIYQVYSE